MEKISQVSLQDGPIVLHHSDNQKRKAVNVVHYRPLFGYAFLLLAIGLVASPLQNIIPEYITILTSPSQLVTDYIALTSLGGAFINTGLLTLLMVLVVYWQGVPVSGPLIAALFMVSGFGFFGKNILNSIPLLLGVYLYSHVQKKPFKNHAIVALFGSSLSPAVSLIAFDGHLPVIFGLLAGYLLGTAIGFVLVPLATHVQSFTQGFNLYNVGFTSGLIGMLVTGLFRMWGWEVENNNLVSNEADFALSCFLLVFAGVLIIFGSYLCYKNKNFQLWTLMRSSGKAVTDFIANVGLGTTLINMGLMALLFFFYVKLMGGQLNGPLIGAIISGIGFSAYGNHPLNSWSLLFGVYLVCTWSTYDIHGTTMLMAAIFSTTLAPVSGFYGAFYGIIAGVFHIGLVVNIGHLHGGLNLYNNGFSGGFVAAMMVPLLDSLNVRKGKGYFGRKINRKKNSG